MSFENGLFWEVVTKSIAGKREIPEPVWLSPDYLPGLDEAQASAPDIMTGAEVQAAQAAGEELVCDIEEYQNYFLAAFMSLKTGKKWFVEFRESITRHDAGNLKWILENFKIITFNGNGFDIPLLALALDGKTCLEIYHAAHMIIYQKIQPYMVVKHYKVQGLKLNHVDLIEVCPLQASLKIYGGRLHVPKMQDLPFSHDSILSEDQITILRHYCWNDLVVTAYINSALKEQLSIRAEMSLKYNIDLRSKSDAQIAEAVIKTELKRLNDYDAKRPEIEEGIGYFYQVPSYINFENEELKKALELVKNSKFYIGESGAVEMPTALKNYQVKLGEMSYRMGIGGLHSMEESVSHVAKEGFVIVDRDVASYYPQIILNQKLYPLHLGHDFLNVYESIVSRRLAAKRSGDKAQADMLKIVINGSFGKFGSKWSVLYAPDLLIQVTLTGQLSLLMLIEKLESVGVRVLSANTDGVVMTYPQVISDTVEASVKEWETLTAFETEATFYRALYSRDVNNYIAVKSNGEVKLKGAYSIGQGVFRFHKNPTNSICVEAVVAFLINGTPISETVEKCEDLSKFLTVRKVNGGAVKHGVFLGKAIRWYYSTECAGPIVYATSGNKVPKSDGTRPCLDLPATFPADVDFYRYECEAREILQEIGVG